MRALLGRLASLIPTLFLATAGVFLLLQLVPGDPAVAIAGEQANVEQLAEIREQLGLNDPIHLQYWNWLSRALQGDLGTSLVSGESVVDAIRRTLFSTMQLVAGALFTAVVIGVPAGVASARRADTVADTVITSAASAGVAMPSFWIGLILVSVFAVQLGWLPATGLVEITSDPWLALKHLTLPAIALGAVAAAEVVRQLRAAMIDVLSSDHVRTLRAKGIGERRIVWRHALKGAAVPLVTIVGLQVSRLLGATVVVETVFGVSGLGTLVVHATQTRDYPVVQGVVLVMALMVVFANFAVDVSYRLLDPRIK